MFGHGIIAKKTLGACAVSGFGELDGVSGFSVSGFTTHLVLKNLKEHTSACLFDEYI